MIISKQIVVSLEKTKSWRWAREQLPPSASFGTFSLTMQGSLHPFALLQLVSSEDIAEPLKKNDRVINSKLK